MARRFLLSVFLLAAASCAKNGSAKPPERPPPLVASSPVEVRDVAVEVHAPIDLRPLEQTDVGSKTLGYLDAVLVDRGDRVHRGQLVAIVRPSDLPDQLAAARGALAQARASATLARANAERAHQLAPRGVVSQQELQQSDAAHAAAEAAETGARAQLDVLAVRLGETRIVSPMDGVVAVRRLDPGALVGPPGGGAIVTVVRIDALRVFVTINEQDARGVTVGKEAHVELDALPGRSAHGHVVRMAPTFDPTTRTLEAEVQLPNKGTELLPGMYGRGSIVVEMHPKAIVVPASAVQISEGKRYLFVVDGAAGKDAFKVQRRAIETGVDGGNWLEVTCGLQVNDEIITAGADALSDGAVVRLSRAGAASPPKRESTPLHE